MNGVRGSAPALLYWQIAFIVSSVLGAVASLSLGDSDDFESAGDVASRLTVQATFGVLAFIGYAVAAAFAMNALRQVDRAVNQTG